jgi:polyhydroxyalkanoate synthase
MHDADSAATEARAPLIEPGPGDKRWKHPAWTSNAVLDAIKQAYLLTSRSLLETVDAAEGLDAREKARMRFFARQFCDAMSPTNFAFLNPAVVEETARSGGRNLLRGTQHLLEDALHNGGRPALVDKTAFAVGKNLAISRGSVVYRNELIEVIQYEPTTPDVFARPLLIVPPWINKYYVLDLQPHNSFIKYATDHGIATFVISWRNPDASLAHLRFEDYLFSGSLAAGAVVREITGSPEINQLGYCLGGTLTSMQLAYHAKTSPGIVNAVTSLASLTDFSDAGDIAALLARDAVESMEEDMEVHGVFAAEKMTDAFTLLRSNDLIWNVAIDRYLLGKPAPAFDLLYWNDDATAMPAAMHSYYLRNMYLENRFAKGELSVRGVPIELGTIENDVYLVASIEDHIAPWKSVYRMTDLFGGDVRFRLGHSGHIAGIVNPPGSGKGRFWSNDRTPGTAADWFAGATEHAGSWWPDWLAWITARSGEKKPAVAEAGSKTYPVLDAAPGTYVFG